MVVVGLFDDQPVTALLRGKRTGVLMALPRHVDNVELLATARLREEAIAEGLEAQENKPHATVNCDGATLNNSQRCGRRQSGEASSPAPRSEDE